MYWDWADTWKCELKWFLHFMMERDRKMEGPVSFDVLWSAPWDRGDKLYL